MARSIAFGFAVLLMLGPASSTNRAQDSLLQEMYGQGVHAYFSGQLDQAHELFTAAIDQGSQDPRCYYFRGLSFAKLGRPDEAEADYRQGAELEASGAAQQINIGLALQRVQGAQRLQLEEHRYQARLAARLKEAQERKERYEQMQRNESQVLRGETPPAGDSAPRQPPPPDATDPFAAGAGVPETPPAESPAEPAETPPAGVDLFGTPAAPAGEMDPAAAPAAAAPAEAAEETDPFADPSQPVEMPAADETPDTSPFGAAAPAPATDADPFGAAAPAAPAAPAPAADADPFGAAAPAAPAAPAPAANADPFGAAAPAAPASGVKPATSPDGVPAAKDDSDILGGADPFGTPPPAVMTEEEEEVEPATGGEPAAKEASDPFADDPE